MFERQTNGQCLVQTKTKTKTKTKQKQNLINELYNFNLPGFDQLS